MASGNVSNSGSIRRVDGRSRQATRFRAKHGNVCGGVSADQTRFHSLTVRHSNDDLIVTLHHVIRGYDQTIVRSDDPAGRMPPPGLDSDYGVSRGLYDPCKIIR
jgi:hypothetical protein